MMELFFPPDVPTVFFSGISMNGTGFDRSVLPGSIAVILFVLWMVKGAPTSERGDHALNIIWVLIGAFVLWGLFGGEAGAAEAPSGSGRPRWAGYDITPLAIIALIVAISGTSKKALAALVVIPAGIAHAGGADPVGPPPNDWGFLLSVAVCFGSLCLLRTAGRHRGTAGTLVFLLLAAASGLHAYQSLPAADAGVIGNLFESDGDRMAAEAERARALAELERLRTENAIRRQTAELDAERQRALLRAAGYHPAGADDGETAAETWILFIAAAGAVGMAAYWLRRSEAAEARIRQLTTRLEIAERAAWGENGRARMLLADRSAEHHQQGDRR